MARKRLSLLQQRILAWLVAEDVRLRAPWPPSIRPWCGPWWCGASTRATVTSLSLHCSCMPSPRLPSKPAARRPASIRALQAPAGLRRPLHRCSRLNNMLWCNHADVRVAKEVSDPCPPFGIGGYEADATVYCRQARTHTPEFYQDLRSGAEHRSAPPQCSESLYGKGVSRVSLVRQAQKGTCIEEVGDLVVVGVDVSAGEIWRQGRERKSPSDWAFFASLSMVSGVNCSRRGSICLIYRSSFRPNDFP